MIVWVWTIAALVGAVIAAWATYDAVLDLRALGATSNGRRILAVGWVRREAIRFLIQVTWAGIGFAALQRPEGPANPLVLLLVGTNVALALNTILDARDRIRLRRIIGYPHSTAVTRPKRKAMSISTHPVRRADGPARSCPCTAGGR